MLSQPTGSLISEDSWLETVLLTGNTIATLLTSTWATIMDLLATPCMTISQQTIVTSLTLILQTHLILPPHAWKSTRNSNLKWLLSTSMTSSASAIRVQVDLWELLSTQHSVDSIPLSTETWRWFLLASMVDLSLTTSTTPWWESSWTSRTSQLNGICAAIPLITLLFKMRLNGSMYNSRVNTRFWSTLEIPMVQYPPTGPKVGWLISAGAFSINGAPTTFLICMGSRLLAMSSATKAV